MTPEVRILTLFGEEYAPEQQVATSKTRRPKKPSTVENNKKPKEETSSKILDGWNAEKQYYSIGEVAALFKVNTSHIRFWTKEFKLKVRTTKKGDRLFTAEHIYEVRNIYHLVKERGFTLAGAKQKLKEEKKNVSDTINLKQSLLKLRNQLQLIRNQLS